MIAVRERADRFHEEIHRSPAHEPVGRPVVRERQVRLPLIALLVTAFVMAAAFGYANALAVNVGYQAEVLRAEIAELEQERQSLSARLDKLDTLSRVELVAVTELGMVHPSPENVMYVAVNPSGAGTTLVDADGPDAPMEPAGPIARHSGEPAGEPAETEGPGIIQAFLELVSR